jgi:hypothetical protein
LFGRLLRRGRLRFDMRTLSAVVWTAWATLSPASLRAFMGLLLRVRNRRSRGIVADSAPMRWSPPVHETKR